MTEKVSFSRMLPEIQEYKKLLDLAEEYEDALTKFEKELVSSLLSQLERRGNDFTVSDNQETALKKIRKKLKSEGVPDA